eukprot:891450-Pelagomonas_calceolata.AAC.2
MEIGGPQIALLASDHAKRAHRSTLGPLFTTKTRHILPPFTTLVSFTFKKSKRGGQNLTFLALLVLDFIREMLGKWLTSSPTTQSFHSIYFAIILLGGLSHPHWCSRQPGMEVLW